MVENQPVSGALTSSETNHSSIQTKSDRSSEAYLQSDAIQQNFRQTSVNVDNHFQSTLSTNSETDLSKKDQSLSTHQLSADTKSTLLSASIEPSSTNVQSTSSVPEVIPTTPVLNSQQNVQVKSIPASSNNITNKSSVSDVSHFNSEFISNSSAKQLNSAFVDAEKAGQEKNTYEPKITEELKREELANQKDIEDEDSFDYGDELEDGDEDEDENDDAEQDYELQQKIRDHLRSTQQNQQSSPQHIEPSRLTESNYRKEVFSQNTKESKDSESDEEIIEDTN